MAGRIEGRGLEETYVRNGRNIDGGWSDVEETVWAISFCDHVQLWAMQDRCSRIKSIEWLNNERTTEGAWGHTSRDIPRIPVTALVLTLLPELADERSAVWLENAWRRDLSAEVKLTYKGALTLKAFASMRRSPANPNLVPETVKYLIGEQNDDGGFGPWKDHPVGSEPWSTGIALIGLTAWPELLQPEPVERALGWLERKQLSNGLWPCHYIEEGSAYCYWGAVEAMKYLKRIGR